MEYNTNTDRYVPTKEEFTMLLEGASIQSLCEQATYTTSGDEGYVGNATCVVCGNTAEFIDANFPGSEDEPCINCMNKENNVMDTNRLALYAAIDNQDWLLVKEILMSLPKKEVLEEAVKHNIQVHKSYRKEEVTTEFIMGLVTLRPTTTPISLEEAYGQKEEGEMEVELPMGMLEQDIHELLSSNTNPMCVMCHKHDPRCSRCGGSGIEPLLTLPQKNFMRDIWKACKAEGTISRETLEMVAVDIREGRMQKGVCVGLIEMMGLSLPEDHPIYISVSTNLVKREMEYWVKLLDKKQNGPDARRLAQHMRRHKAIRFDVSGDAKWIEVAREMNARASSLLNNSINNRF